MAKFVLVFLLLFVAQNCGAKQAGRIVGGRDAIEGEFPYQISLRLNGSHHCGGSILSATYVLTAAQCVGYYDYYADYYVYEAKELSIRAGSNDRFNGGVIVQVEEIFVHENYGNYFNDIAIVGLKESLIYSKNIQAIPLATAELSSGQEATISGWGQLKTAGDTPRKLQRSTMSAISRLECQSVIGVGSDNFLCLVRDDDGGSCNGDTGGPAVYNGKLVGVAGVLLAYCGSSIPDGYTKVYYHYNWIKSHAKL